MKSITYHPTVQADVNQAMGFYYREASDKVALQFWEELSESLTFIRTHPEACHIDEKSGLKRRNLKQFPYNILFEAHPNFVRIQVVRHNKKRSTFGTRRR